MKMLLYSENYQNINMLTLCLAIIILLAGCGSQPADAVEREPNEAEMRQAMDGFAASLSSHIHEIKRNCANGAATEIGDSFMEVFISTFWDCDTMASLEITEGQRLINFVGFYKVDDCIALDLGDYRCGFKVGMTSPYTPGFMADSLMRSEPGEGRFVRKDDGQWQYFPDEF